MFKTLLSMSVAFLALQGAKAESIREMTKLPTRQETPSDLNRVDSICLGIHPAAYMVGHCNEGVLQAALALEKKLRTFNNSDPQTKTICELRSVPTSVAELACSDSKLQVWSTLASSSSPAYAVLPEKDYIFPGRYVLQTELAVRVALMDLNWTKTPSFKEGIFIVDRFTFGPRTVSYNP